MAPIIKEEPLVKRKAEDALSEVSSPRKRIKSSEDLETPVEGPPRPSGPRVVPYPEKASILRRSTFNLN